MSISKRDKTIVADIDLEKRFYLSPDGVKLNVSAGLPVPEGRSDKVRKKPCSTDTATLSHNVLQRAITYVNVCLFNSCRWTVALNCASNPNSGNS